MDIKKTLKSVTTKTSSGWVLKVQAKLGKPWLTDYSSQIARRLIMKIKNEKLWLINNYS